MEEARILARHISTNFNAETRAFLATRWEEFRAVDYDSLVTALGKAGLVLRDGKLALSA